MLAIIIAFLQLTLSPAARVDRGTKAASALILSDETDAALAFTSGDCPVGFRCDPVHCPIKNSNQELQEEPIGPSCKCKSGYIGKVSWHGSVATGVCAKPDDVIPVGALFSQGSNRFIHEGSTFKCCSRGDGVETDRVTDVTDPSALPKCPFGYFKRAGCGCIHGGSEWHNAKEACAVSLSHLSVKTSLPMETLADMLVDAQR